MEILISLVLIVSGFAILIFGGDLLVKAAVSIAAKWKVNPAIIGLTIIAAGTSAPELVTSVLASLRDAPDVAIGNIVGSNIFNILAVLGVAAMFRPFKVEASIVKIEMPMLVVCTILFIGLSWDLDLTFIDGGLCIGALLTLLFFSINRAKKIGYQPDEEITKLSSTYKDAIYLFIGISALVGGANLSLEGGVVLGQLAGLSDRVIGIAIISVGTGLPELATSAVAAFKKQNEIAISNVIGSNLINVMGVTGVASLFKNIHVSESLAHFDSLVMLAITVLLIPVIIGGKYNINRAVGLTLVVAYSAYIFQLL